MYNLKPNLYLAMQTNNKSRTAEGYYLLYLISLVYNIKIVQIE